MITRRTLLVQAAAAGAMAVTAVDARGEVNRTAQGGGPLTLKKHPQIRSVVPRVETVLRLGGCGDNFHMSWAADDRQYVSVCDGTGWLQNAKQSYNSRLWAITGGPAAATFEDVSGYPDLADDPDAGYEVGRYYNYGTLALDGHIYQYLALEKYAGDRAKPDAEYYWSHARWYGAKLIYSPDNGRTWRNQDGSTPVVWETLQQQSRKNMVFYEEPQGAFWMLMVLQMGRNYEYNRDGYVYVYGHNGNIEGMLHEIVMFRVPKARILHRDSYEFFAGLQSNGEAKWARDIDARAVVNRAGTKGLWSGSVVYNAPLGLYLMSGTVSRKDSKVTGLGFWTASRPWGPWTQIYENFPWQPGNDPDANGYQPQIAPKWIAADGRCFWLVWSDFRFSVAKLMNIEIQKRKQELDRLSKPERIRTKLEIFRRYMPNYAFNVQRFDLSL